MVHSRLVVSMSIFATAVDREQVALMSLVNANHMLARFQHKPSGEHAKSHIKALESSQKVIVDLIQQHQSKNGTVHVLDVGTQLLLNQVDVLLDEIQSDLFEAHAAQNI